MPLTDADRQRIILNEVGDVDPASRELVGPYPDNAAVSASVGLLATNIALFWDSYADIGDASPTLRDLYVKRRSIDTVLGALQDLVPESGEGVTVQYAARIATLNRMRTDVTADILVAEQRATGVRLPAVGTILTTEPVGPRFPNQPDANHPRFGGSAYWRGWRRW